MNQISFVMIVSTVVFTDAYRNLVKPGVTTATQKSTYSYYDEQRRRNVSFDANKAIDGQPSQVRFLSGSCSHTGLLQREAWLQINLGKVYNIKEVKFWYRNDGRGDLIETSRLHYYSMFYWNPVNKSWVRCYRDETPFNQSIPMPSTVSCNSKTAVIQFYTTQPSPIDKWQVFLEICEVEVYGCDVNQYGEDCTNCSERCSECDVVRGCVSCYPRSTGSNCEVCQPGYMGNNCENPCTGGWYGQNCSMECSPHCLDNSTCTPENGVCPKGCNPGYNGSMCIEECKAGTYGTRCEGQCSGNCYGNKTCNFVTGYCDSGCSRGWDGPKCLRPCENGSFGENCASNCSGHCYQNQTCDRFYGTCPNGCDPGWTGDSCDKGCNTGTYGLLCNNTCGHCFEETCNTVSGLCQRGCIDGWTGEKCEEVCTHGYFGRQCQKECGKCQTEGCNHVNGSCDGKCLDGWVGKQCLQALASQSEGTDPSIPMAGVGAGAGAVVIIAVLVVIAVIFVRLRRKKSNASSENFMVSADKGQNTNTEPRTSVKIPPTDINELKLEPVYYNANDTAPETDHAVTKISTDKAPPSEEVNYDKNILIGDLPFIFASKSDDDFKEIKTEYQSIPYGEQGHLSCSYGKLAKNIPKNRFKTTFPYDHSRVILKDPTSDYINANYIKNLKGKRAFIAAQGPRPTTVSDHWGMIWQENVTNIVMLTNLIEGTKKKCEKYWPDLHLEAVFGKFKVLLLTEKQYACYVIRRMKVTFMETESSRTVTQFHYTQWPDHGVPDPIDLVVFQKHVKRLTEKQKDRLILVHCSAGIGRTGTFIALDVLHQNGLENGTVNVEEYVRIMRNDRMSMVQNAEQYVVLHQALLESFKGLHEIFTLQSFKAICQELQGATKSPPVWLRTQFEELQSIKKTYSAKEHKAGLENKDLNMTRNIIPVDRFRAVLTTPVDTRAYYYNAVFLSTFKHKDALIGGQYPLSGNSVDLFRLLYDHDSKIVVFINQLTDIPSTGEWISDKKMSLDPFEIMKKESCSISNSLKKHTFSVTNTEQDTNDEIHVYEITTWRLADPLPLDLEVISELIRSLRNSESEPSGEERITILSKDGAFGCGMLCAVYNALQQLEQDEEVDLFTIIRQLQIRRPEMISTWEEFRSCFIATYMALNSAETVPETYSNTESVYANM